MVPNPTCPVSILRDSEIRGGVTVGDMSLDDILDSATPLTTDVELYIDGGLVAKRDELVREFKALQEQDAKDLRAGQRPRVLEIADELKALQERMSARAIVIRITQMPAEKWSALKAKFPLKGKPENQPVRDRNLGFSTEAVARLALVDYGHRVTGDGEAHKIDTDMWTRLFDTMSGGDVDTLVAGVLGVNQLNGQMHAEQLLKR